MHLVRAGALNFRESRSVHIAGWCTLVLEVGAPKYSVIMDITLRSLADDNLNRTSNESMDITEGTNCGALGEICPKGGG